MLRMEEVGITRSELADRLNKKRPKITHLLRGNNNFTIATMVEIADALGCNYRSHLEPREGETMWLTIAEKKVSLGAAEQSLGSKATTSYNEFELEEDMSNGELALTA